MRPPDIDVSTDHKPLAYGIPLSAARVDQFNQTWGGDLPTLPATRVDQYYQTWVVTVILSRRPESTNTTRLGWHLRVDHFFNKASPPNTTRSTFRDVCCWCQSKLRWYSYTENSNIYSFRVCATFPLPIETVLLTEPINYHDRKYTMGSTQTESRNLATQEFWPFKTCATDDRTQYKAAQRPLIQLTRVC